MRKLGNLNRPRFFMGIVMVAVFVAAGLTVILRSQASTPPGDINNDSKIDVFDLSLLLNAWGTNNLASDLNNSGKVDVFDLSVLLTNWGAVAATPAPTPTSTPSPSPAGTPVQAHGDLHVCGLKLCNKNNVEIQLRGMSTHGIQWYGYGATGSGKCITPASLNTLATDFKADHLRISMYIQEGGYETDPAGFTAQVDKIIDEVTARGMYAIVDWHQLNPGDPNYNLTRAKSFFAHISQKYGSQNNILYDIANEPNSENGNVSWATVKKYHDAVIPVIRANDPNAVILLGTHGWSTFGYSDSGNPQSYMDIVNNPVTASNIMYTFHFYAASHGADYRSMLTAAADKLPVFVTEFGTQQASGDGSNTFTSSQAWLDLLAAKKISWTNWNYSDDSRTGAVWNTGTCGSGSFVSTNLKAAGSWVRERMRNR